MTVKVPVLDTIYDRLYNARPRAVANVSMQTLSTLQHHPADLQLAATGVLLLTVCRKYGANPANVLNCVDNLMKDSTRYDKATFKGITEYFNNEI